MTKLEIKIEKIIAVLEKEFPELSVKTGKSEPLDMLIATMLSQNTTDKTSYRAFTNLKNDFKDWKTVMEAPLSKIRNSIKVCGLANQKSKNIKTLLKNLSQQNGKLSLRRLGKMSNEEIYSELLQYSGIGVKTVSCVLAFSLGRDVFPVDTHVHRLANRLGLAESKTAEKTFSQLEHKIPEGKKLLLHSLLIRFGRKVCRSNNPLCLKCSLFDLCEFNKKEFFAELGLHSGSIPKENNFIILEHV
jgi:endonuclease III